MKSHVYVLRAAIAHVRRFVLRITDDKITLYAAQASFFVIISAVPFLSLLISVTGMLLSLPAGDFLSRLPIPSDFSSVIYSVLEDLQSTQNVPLLSVSAVTTLWSASRGISAIRSGIERVYRAGHTRGFFAHRLKSLISTLLFIAFIAATVALMLFGDFALEWLSLGTSCNPRFITPLFTVALCVLFTAMYSSTARRSTRVRRGILPHIPGAIFSSVGWMLFSRIYSLYITHFPSASYIYGSLAALCFIMLWLYFCMIILLLGAELNGFILTLKNQSPL